MRQVQFRVDRAACGAVLVAQQPIPALTYQELALGKAKITVQTHNKKKATITVQVVDPNKPLGIAIAQGKAITMKMGESVQLGVGLNPATAQTTLTWKTNKPAIASVDGNGVVTAVKKGKAKITVTTYNKKKATITVNVVE